MVELNLSITIDTSDDTLVGLLCSHTALLLTWAVWVGCAALCLCCSFRPSTDYYGRFCRLCNLSVCTSKTHTRPHTTHHTLPQPTTLSPISASNLHSTRLLFQLH